MCIHLITISLLLSIHVSIRGSRRRRRSDRHDDAIRLVEADHTVRADLQSPGWATALDDYRLATPKELPTGFRRGWWDSAPIVDMPAYSRLVANCTGVGAAALTADEQLYPTRGQLVAVKNPGIAHFFCEHDESPTPTYFLPHGDVLVLGGSAEPGRTDRTPDEAIGKEIRARCAVIEPSIGDDEKAPFLEHRVGLRPSRPAVRLDVERIGRGTSCTTTGTGAPG